MNLLRTCIVVVVAIGAFAPAAGADPWFADRPQDASTAPVITGDRPGDVIHSPAPISGDRPADRLARVVIPAAARRDASFDWIAAGLGAASAFALVGVVFGGLALAGRRRGPHEEAGWASS